MASGTESRVIRMIPLQCGSVTLSCV
jgi:hypothetical protein